jgi:ribosomal subunit interface protein
MQITVTGQQIDVGDALRTHIEDAIAGTTEKYFADAIEATVVLSRESFRIRATISMHVGRGIHVRAHEEADDAYAAFDAALAHFAKRLREHHPDRETIVASANAPEYILAPQTEDDADTQPNDDNPVIIAENQTVVENLTVSEAVMRLDLADAPASVFRNSKHGGLGRGLPPRQWKHRLDRYPGGRELT